MHVFIFGTSSLLKAFGKDPLDSDNQEEVNSDTESEEQEESDKEHDTPKEVDKAGIVDSPNLFPLVSFKIFILIYKKNT